MYLEDIYVKPEMRGCGIGKALLRRLAQIAKQRNYGRIEWAVLNWNEPAIRFYQSIGAQPLSEWTTYRMIGEAVDRLEALED
jgi:ribosomal protein S18 acetylase RimI-like enzyme